MFVGREAELALLRAELRQAAAGPARRVVVEGPEGVGKTALIRRALRDAPGTRVLAVSGDPDERRLRYGLLRRLLPGAATDDPWAAGQAMCDAILRSQAGGPVVVLVDDLHWADPPSLRALGYALRRLDGQRVLTLTACRDAEDPALPAGLRRLLAGACRLSLQGLSAADLARLPGGAPEGATGPGERPRGDVGGPRKAAGAGRRLLGGGTIGEPPSGGSGRILRLPDLAAPPDRTGTASRRTRAWMPRDRAGTDSIQAEALSQRAAARLHAHTLGNPLHALALLDVLPASLLADPGTRLPAPVTYARTFTRRLRSCGPPARALIAACAVLGETCTLYEAATAARALTDTTATGSAAATGAEALTDMAGLTGTAARAGAGHFPDSGETDTPESASARRDDREFGSAAGGGAGDAPIGLPELDALEQAVTAGVLVEEAGRVIRFREPLGRAAAYDGLGAGTRARLHLAAARIAGDTGTELRHRAAAAAGPDEELAGNLARHAAEEARRGLWDDAATLLELAAGLTSSADRREELRTAVLEHVLTGGDAIRAARLAAPPDTGASPARGYAPGPASPDSGESPGRGYVSGPAPPDSGASPARRYVLGWLALVEGRLEEAGRLLEEAWAHREPSYAAAIAERLAWVRLLGDDRPGAARWARTALDQPIQSPVARPYDVLALAGDPCPQAPPGSVAEAVRLLRHDDVGKAREVLERAAGDPAGPLAHRLLAVALLAVAEYRDGRWDDAVRRAEQAVAEAAGLGQRWLLPCLRVVCVAPLAARGEHQRALAHVAAAREEARRQRGALGETQADLAMAVLGAGAAPPSAGDVFVPDPRPLLVETLVAEGAIGEARTVLDGLDDIGDGPLARAQRARLEGLLLTARNVPATAEERLTAALRLAGEGGCRMEEARVLLDLGRLLRRTGRRRAAAERLQAAWAVFAGLGAAPMAERCARELEACGLEPVVTARLGLTRQEFSTATLVAEGLTDRQIARQLLVSVRTVEDHIGKIYTKLGIGSRAALIARLAAYGETP